jgi:hypothetical protein
MQDSVVAKKGMETYKTYHAERKVAQLRIAEDVAVAGHVPECGGGAPAPDSLGSDPSHPSSNVHIDDDTAKAVEHLAKKKNGHRCCSYR